MKKRKGRKTIPEVKVLEAELKRVKHKKQFGKVMNSTIYALITVAALAVLVAVLFLPVLQIYGNSMSPGLNDGDIVLSVKGTEFEKGDIIAFYYNNKILVKRVIARAGEWVNMDEEGNVFVNGEMLEEPYLTRKAYGDCNIELPYQVPEGRIFVLGDHREVSVDSRNSAVGCVAEEQIVGELMFRVWPFEQIGTLIK